MCYPDCFVEKTVKHQHLHVQFLGTTSPVTQNAWLQDQPNHETKRDRQFGGCHIIGMKTDGP